MSATKPVRLADGSASPKPDDAKPTPKLVSVSPSINEKKFSKVLEMLYRAIINNRGMYSSIRMATHAPQIKYYPGSPSLLPENWNPNQLVIFGENEKTPEVVEPRSPVHERWLWFAVHEDIQDLSESVYPAHCKLYADHPEFYGPKVVSIPPEEFGRMLKEKDASGKVKYKVGEEKRVVAQWQRCAKTLFEEFDGSPVKLFTHAGWSVDAVYSWKKKQEKIRGYDPIPGWGTKLISLYFLYLADLGYPFPDDAFPADLHAQALILQTECLNWGTAEVINSRPLAELIRKFVTKLCKERNWEVLLLAHAQWLKGSFLCNGCASNKLVPSLCVIYDQCGGRIDTGSYTMGKWFKNNRVHTKSGKRPRFGLPIDVPVRMTRELKRKNKEPETPTYKDVPLFPKT